MTSFDIHHACQVAEASATRVGQLQIDFFRFNEVILFKFEGLSYIKQPEWPEGTRYDFKRQGDNRVYSIIRCEPTDYVGAAMWVVMDNQAKVYRMTYSDAVITMLTCLYLPKDGLPVYKPLPKLLETLT